MLCVHAFGDELELVFRLELELKVRFELLRLLEEHLGREMHLAIVVNDTFAEKATGVVLGP